MKRSPLARRTPLRGGKALARGKGVRKRNPTRRRHAFARAYESRERVRWVASLPCVVILCHERPCQNAHTGRGAGMGFKGPSSEIFPACPRHHRELHDHGPGWFARQYGITKAMLYDAAEATEIGWRAYGGEYGE